MAWLELDASGTYFVCFRLGSQRFKRSLDTAVEDDAKAQKSRLEENIRLYERGRFDIPQNGDLVTFLLSDGRRGGGAEVPKHVTLAKLFKIYFDGLPDGSLEANSIDTMKLHQKHLQRLLGASFQVRGLVKDDLQRFIIKRAKEGNGRGGRISANTINKEIVTLRTVWNWAARTYVDGRFPSKGLKYPKSSEKPPFMAFAEVEERTKGMAEDAAAELWEAVYLTVNDLNDLLKHIENYHLPFVYPAFVFAAHTGARRSEIARARVSDVDLKNGWMTIRERKRAHDRRTTRRVPISPTLLKVLTDWLLNHPGGDALFCHHSQVDRSRKRSKTTGHQWKNRSTSLAGRLVTVKQRLERPSIGALTRNELHDHFKRALAGSRWQKLRGFHVLRHSFISCLASSRVDQRMIDEWSGHQTEEQRRRYRHLFPNVSKQAIASVFG